MARERGVHVLQGFGHAQPRGMQGPAWVIVQDATDRRTIIPHHILRVLSDLDGGGPGGLGWGGGQRGRLRGAPFGSHLPCARPPPPDSAPHLHLGAAIGVEHGLGDIP
jgi:hypothetical protein